MGREGCDVTEAEKWKRVAEVLASRLVVLQRKEKDVIIQEALKYVAKYEKAENSRKKQKGAG